MTWKPIPPTFTDPMAPVNITPYLKAYESRVAELEAALLHDRAVIERVIRDEQGAQWLLDTLTAIDKVLGNRYGGDHLTHIHRT